VMSLSRAASDATSRAASGRSQNPGAAIRASRASICECLPARSKKPPQVPRPAGDLIDGVAKLGVLHLPWEDAKDARAWQRFILVRH
jgi:hypothetical protein